jgi:hypothetical protein
MASRSAHVSIGWARAMKRGAVGRAMQPSHLGSAMPSPVILVPFAGLYALLTLICGIEAVAIVFAAAGLFAAPIYGLDALASLRLASRRGLGAMWMALRIRGYPRRAGIETPEFLNLTAHENRGAADHHRPIGWLNGA